VLQPNAQRKLSITWQPSVYGNMRKLIKIEEVDNNRKYDFVIFGNCIDPLRKKLKVSYIRDFFIPILALYLLFFFYYYLLIIL